MGSPFLFSSSSFGLMMLLRLFLLGDGISIVVKLGPLEKGATLLARDVAGMAHPEIPAPVLPLPLHDP